MIQVSAFPTVEWLRSRAADRPPVSRAGRRLTGMSDRTRHLDSDTERSLGSVPTRRPGRGRIRSADRARRAGCSERDRFLESLAARVAGTLAPGAGVYVNEWVSTPDGEQPVDVVIQRGARRIGLVARHRYEEDTETVDALRLVYGGFDVLHRVNRVDAHRSVDDALYALVCEKPSWFTAAGRIGAARRASGEARISIRRMRLSRANEWVAAFERALRSPGSPAIHPAGHPERD